MESQKDYSYLSPEYIFRLPFTIKSIQWGVTLGTFLACHKHYRTRSFKGSVLYGVLWGLCICGAYWSYSMYEFMLTQHTLRSQTFAKQQASQHSEFTKFYFRDKFHLHDYSEEQLNSAVDYMDSKWSEIQETLEK